jgi:hypothetical protein
MLLPQQEEARENSTTIQRLVALYDTSPHPICHQTRRRSKKVIALL